MDIINHVVLDGWSVYRDSIWVGYIKSDSWVEPRDENIQIIGKKKIRFFTFLGKAEKSRHSGLSIINASIMMKSLSDHINQTVSKISPTARIESIHADLHSPKVMDHPQYWIITYAT